MTEAGQDRRRGDRRRADRRAPARGGDEGESFFDPGWLSGGSAPPEEAADDGALARIYRIYGAARAALGVALIAAQAANNLMGARTSPWLALLCIAYAGQAVTLWLLPRFRGLAAPRVVPAQRRRQWLATIGVDLLSFGAMHVLDSGSSFNYGALLVLPVLMAGVMTQRLLALGTAAGVALVLLLNAWHSGVAGGEFAAPLLQAGLAGIGLFVIALLAGELAARLAREEQAARGSLAIARQQAQLNRLVIEEMVDGVLVVDRDLRVRAANPAARALLVDAGLSPPAPFELRSRPAWAALAAAVDQALIDLDWPAGGREVTLGFEGGERRTLRMRVRFMRRSRLSAVDGADPAESLCVLLLEDARTAQARLQQERLAAMGRVSAGIAHEIRNPLAAIAQANALLLEDPLPPAQQRLAQMVADNAERLKRIVDDVMELAPGAVPPPVAAIDVAAVASSAASEWAATGGIAAGEARLLRFEMPPRPTVAVFDPEHLRRVLVNLLDNARRHASDAPGAIVLRVAGGEGGPVTLTVASDGAPIPPEVERHLFEPFFSTRSRGTGLGLYICRELCERYGARIEYRTLPATEPARKEFVVTMRRAAAGLPTP